GIRFRLPVNMAESSGSLGKVPIYGTNQPQKAAAAATPTNQAARLPAKLFPLRSWKVYRPYRRPKVEAAVSHQLRRRMLMTPMSLGRKRRTVYAPSRYQITPL